MHVHMNPIKSKYFSSGRLWRRAKFSMDISIGTFGTPNGKYCQAYCLWFVVLLLFDISCGADNVTSLLDAFTNLKHVIGPLHQHHQSVLDYRYSTGHDVSYLIGSVMLVTCGRCQLSKDNISYTQTYIGKYNYIFLVISPSIIQIYASQYIASTYNYFKAAVCTTVMTYCTHTKI